MEVLADAQVLADTNTGVLLRSFLIAVVLVTPYGIWQWIRVRRTRAARRAGEATAVPPRADREPALPRLEDLIAEIDRRAAEMRPGEATTVEVPLRSSIDDEPADPALVDALVRDVLRRGALRPVAEVDVAEVRRIDCVKG